MRKKLMSILSLREELLPSLKKNNISPMTPVKTISPSPNMSEIEVWNPPTSIRRTFFKNVAKGLYNARIYGECFNCGHVVEMPFGNTYKVPNFEKKYDEPECCPLCKVKAVPMSVLGDADWVEERLQRFVYLYANNMQKIIFCKNEDEAGLFLVYAYKNGVSVKYPAIGTQGANPALITTHLQLL